MHRRLISLAVTVGLLVLLGGVASATGAQHVPSVPPPAAAGREQVGTVEAVERVLGYLGADRSTALRYPGAEYVKVHLNRVLLLPGDYLTVADPTGSEVHRYESEPLLGLTGGRWATSVTGDTAVVTLHQTRRDPLGVRASLARLGVTVDKVARGFTPAEAPDPGPTGREESLCGRDDSRGAACYRSSHPVAYQGSKAVVRLLIGGAQMCTAFRVGAGNRLLTNHHCVATEADIRNTEVWFNYQCAECGSWEVFRPTKVRGSRLLVTDPVLDFALFTVDHFERVQHYGHLELDPRPLKAGEEIYIPQHPAGAPTRIAMDSSEEPGGNCAIRDPRAHGYGWHTDASYLCDTKGGSSGAPVLSRRDHRVVALHHFGGCPNSGVRMDLIYPHIAPAL